MMPAEFEIENGVLLKYHGARADVTVPEGVTQIGKDAFHDCWTLRSVFIPDGVTQIGAGAFENSTVTSIRLDAVSTHSAGMSSRDTDSASG